MGWSNLECRTATSHTCVIVHLDMEHNINDLLKASKMRFPYLVPTRCVFFLFCESRMHYSTVSCMGPEIRDDRQMAISSLSQQTLRPPFERRIHDESGSSWTVPFAISSLAWG
jgi:hypothetical protein